MAMVPGVTGYDDDNQEIWGMVDDGTGDDTGNDTEWDTPVDGWTDPATGKVYNAGTGTWDDPETNTDVAATPPGDYTGQREGDKTWDGSAWVPTAQYVDPTTGSDEVIAKPGQVAGDKLWDGSAWVANTKEALIGVARRTLGSALGRNPSEKELADGVKKLTSGGPDGLAGFLSDNKGALLAGGLMAAVLADKDKKQETTVETSIGGNAGLAVDKGLQAVLDNKYDPGKGGLSTAVTADLKGLETTAGKTWDPSAAGNTYDKTGKLLQAGGALAAGLDANQTAAAGLAAGSSLEPKYDAKGNLIPAVGPDGKPIVGNVWKDSLRKAGLGTEEAMKGMVENDLKPYINEYWRTALNPQLTQYDIETGKQKLDLQSQAAKAGAFGGSRFGLMDTELGRNRDFVRQGTIDTGAKDAFDRAANLWGADKNRQMTGASQLGTLGKTAADLNTGDINNLASTGAVGQAYEQNKLTKNYDEWLRQQGAQKDYGITALNTQVNQDALDEKNKQFATTLPGTNATSLGTLAGLSKKTKTVGTAPPLLSQLAGVGTTLFGLNKLTP